MLLCVFFFKQKTAYEMRISDWSSDVCSSDLLDALPCQQCRDLAIAERRGAVLGIDDAADHRPDRRAGTFLSPPGNLRWEECLQFIDTPRRRHPFVAGDPTNGRLVHADAVGDLAQRQRNHAFLAIFEERLLALEDRAAG